MKISEKFKELHKKKQAALIPYITVGFPSIKESPKLISTIINAGADIIELGLPFSDPIADGPTIQTSSQQSLNAGINTDIYFNIAHSIGNKIP